MDTRIKLSKEKRDIMINSIKHFFLEERGEDLGDLASSQILDLFINELAREVYNQGIADSYKYITNKLEDIWEIQK